MNWVEKHLNWTYGVIVIISLIMPIILVFTTDNPIFLWGFMGYYVITIVGGELVLWRKKQSSNIRLYMFPPIFAIVVLCKHNKREQAKPLAPSSAT